MAEETIHIVGAGPAGLVAAINLKREGFNVVMHEAEREIGGPPSWHPSIHATPADFDTLEDFIGIDVSPAFKDCYDHLLYFDHGVQRPFDDFIGEIDCMYAVIRGPHPKSLDNFLYEIARSEGVEFHFSEVWGKEEFDNAPEQTIVTTGFGQSAYEALEYKFTPFYGFWTRQECDPEQTHLGIYEDDYTNEYGYTGSKDGLWYALIFARGDITQEGLEKFSQTVSEKEHVTLPPAAEWGRFTGSTTRFPRLFDRQFIFGGTASGFIDPAQGYGILASMIGGKIAAMAVTDPEGAQKLYDGYIDALTKHIALKFQPDYKSSIHFRKGQLWFDIPLLKRAFAIAK